MHSEGVNALVRRPFNIPEKSCILPAASEKKEDLS